MDPTAEVPGASARDAAAAPAGPLSACRWARVRAVFLSALDQRTAARAAFVAQAGGAETRREVESLLASDAAAGSFCEAPAAALLGSLEPDAAPARRRLPIGSRVQDFEIADFLGSGGMGEVYLARDHALRRLVAIKTVGAELAEGSATGRLLVEAQHASVLRHPHICAIHHVGDDHGLPFIVMEYVDGEPLHERLQSGPLSLTDALTCGAQIAGAIEHAHTRGIVHRDLKSSNVLISPERGAVVLDFGLAKRLPQDDEQQTATSVRLAELAGTLSHMAPELLLGNRADARSDVWALGVLLNEMVSGRLPFAGRTPFETTSAILSGPPAPLPRSIPLGLRLVIARCLEKDPSNRYQRAGDVAAALERVRSRYTWPLVPGLLLSRGIGRRAPAAALLLAGLTATLIMGANAGRLFRAADPAMRTLAVLTFDSHEDDVYYAAGVTDAIIAELGELRELRVISRASIDRLRQQGSTPQEIAELTGAAAVVHGTLERTSTRIAAEVRLMEAATGRVLWSDRFDRGIRDVLALQAHLVTALERQLPAGLRLEEARARKAAVRAVNPDVYEAYLHGRYYWGQRTSGSLLKAVDAFTRAIALDPTFAPAHAALADCYNQLGTVLLGSGSPAAYRPQAAAAAIKALQLDPLLAEAHATLGYVKHYDWEWDEAERHLRRAIELNPSYPLARIWYANVLMSRGRFEEALRHVYIAGDLDPFSLVVNTNIGWVLAFARRHEEAAAQFERTLGFDPTYVQAHQRLAASLVALGRPADALQHAERAVTLTHRSPAVLSGLVPIYVQLGRRADAETILQEMVEATTRQYVPPWSLARAYLDLGDRETAIQWIMEAAEERSNGVAYFGIDVNIDELRDDPRIRALLARAGLEHVYPPGRSR